MTEPALEAKIRREYAEYGAKHYHKAGAEAPAGTPAQEPISPTPLRRAPPTGEPFPVGALGDVLGGAVRAIADKVQCPPALAGASILGAASLAAQSHADVVIPATGQARPLSLFLVAVAESGSRKSAADYEAMRAVRVREKVLRELYEGERPDFLRARRAYEIALGNAEKTKGDRFEIATALEAVGEPPREPLLPFLLCDEPSLEGLHKLFERGQPSLGLFSDEGGGFLGGFAMSSENRLRTLAGLSLFWDGAAVRRIRAGDGASILLGRRLAFSMMLQPEASRGLLADGVAIDQGFLSRVLVCAPSSLAGTRMQRPVRPESETALHRYKGVLRNLLEMPAPIAAGTVNVLEPRRLPFDARAAALWSRLADEIERKLAQGGEFEAIKGFASKLAEHIARLSGVLALADDPDVTEIDAETLGRAAVLGDFFASEAVRLFEAGATAPEIVTAEKALAWLMARGEPMFGLAELYQFGPNCIRDVGAARKALKVLEDHDWVTKLEGSRHIVGGQTVREAWRLNGTEA
jgi:hypothetical protein